MANALPTPFVWGDISLSEVVFIDGIPHATRRAIGEWAEYADPQKAVDNILARNPHIEAHSVPLNLRAADGKNYDTFVYHPIGFLLIVFESGQPKAHAMKAAVAEFVWRYAGPQKLDFRARKDRGPAVCPGVQAHRDKVDARLLAAIREDLLSPDAIAKLQATVKQLLDEHRRNAAIRAKEAKARRAELDAEIGRLVEAIAAVGISPAITARLHQAEAERDRLSAEPNDSDDTLTVIDALQRYRKLLADLEATLATTDTDRAREILRGMITPATMVAREGQVWVEMETGRAAIAVGLSLGLVAGAGFEPATGYEAHD